MAKERTRAKKSGCDCVDQIDAKLADRNTKLNLEVFSERCVVESMKIDSKKRGAPVRVLASYCPFCGKKYPESE